MGFISGKLVFFFLTAAAANSPCAFATSDYAQLAPASPPSNKLPFDLPPVNVAYFNPFSTAAGSQFHMDFQRLLYFLVNHTAAPDLFSYYYSGDAKAVSICFTDTACSDCLERIRQVFISQAPLAFGARLRTPQCYMRYENYSISASVKPRRLPDVLPVPLPQPNNLFVSTSPASSNFQMNSETLLDFLVNKTGNRYYLYYTAGYGSDEAFAISDCFRTRFKNTTRCSSCLASARQMLRSSSTAGAQYFVLYGHSFSGCFLRYENYPIVPTVTPARLSSSASTPASSPTASPPAEGAPSSSHAASPEMPPPSQNAPPPPSQNAPPTPSQNAPPTPSQNAPPPSIAPLSLSKPSSSSRTLPADPVLIFFAFLCCAIL